MDVAYKLVDGFPLYRVGDDGSLWSLYKREGRAAVGDVWTRSAKKPGARGYVSCLLYGIGGKRRWVRIHVLVCEAFHGAMPFSGAMALHTDGNPANNAAGNIRWGSQSDNMQDAVKHGTILHGEKHCRAVLTEALVRNVWSMLVGGKRVSEVARLHGLNRKTVCNVGHGHTWKRLTETLPPIPKRGRSPVGQGGVDREGEGSATDFNVIGEELNLPESPSPVEPVAEPLEGDLARTGEIALCEVAAEDQFAARADPAGE